MNQNYYKQNLQPQNFHICNVVIPIQEYSTVRLVQLVKLKNQILLRIKHILVE